EGNRLIRQIKENVSNLYSGTRDILWTLNPGSDRLSEIAGRLGSIGIEIFQDTPIEFRFEKRLRSSDDLQLPASYGRNMLMIFKEAMNNSLKYSDASQISLTIEKAEEGELNILLKDNGVGFDPVQAKRGHGTGNMFKRAKRIQSEFIIESRPQCGTACRLITPLGPGGKGPGPACFGRF
ncbi:MAG TPA: ATP-binding protein, partial [Puia sp.]